MSLIEINMCKHEAVPMTANLEQWCCRWCFKRTSPTALELKKWRGEFPALTKKSEKAKVEEGDPKLEAPKD